MTNNIIKASRPSFRPIKLNINNKLNPFSDPNALTRVVSDYSGNSRHLHHKTHKQSELLIKGNDRYIHHMYKHLRKEHPSTRNRMTERI